MDFETRYTHEEEAQREQLRPEVRAWLAEHAPGVEAPPDAADLDYEQFQRNRAFLRKLGQAGWYAPTWPKEYGGGGLDAPVAAVIREELEAHIAHIANVHLPGDIGGSVGGALWQVGTDEQKQRLLPAILRGEVIVWELFTEPEAGSDLPSLTTRAERQGDAYVINGTKTLVGGNYEADYLFTLAITNPDAARRENLSTFLIPADLPGITKTDLDMIAGSHKSTIMFDDVRVPATYLIGKEGEGWTAFSTGLHGALTVGLGPGLDRGDRVLDQLIEYCKRTDDGGTPLSSKPDVQDVLTQIYIDGQVQRLLQTRTDWMTDAGLPTTYEGIQVVLGRKLFDLKLGEAIHKALGPLSMIDDPSWAAAGGEFEHFHRYAILMAHPGGTVEIQKLRMFRGMTQDAL